MHVTRITDVKMVLFAVSLLLFAVTIESKDYTMIVQTSNDKWAGTDSTVKIRVRGTFRNINERALPTTSSQLEKGRKDTFLIQDYDIGYVKGMDIYRDNSGIFPDWRLDYIIIQIDNAPNSNFNYNGWVDHGKWITLTLSCDQGYAVNNQGFCADKDECVPSNPCGPNFKCVNNVGSYRCKCSDGYELVPGDSNQCQDKDECKQYPCDLSKSVCHNFPGGYRCNCKSGYKNFDPTRCQNINECGDNTDSCNKTISNCMDTDGDYWCSCLPGYTQGSNRKLCQPVRCGALYSPVGGRFEPARCTQFNANVFGDRCVLKCIAGYVISDISSAGITCGSSTKWEGTRAKCNAVTCPKLSPIANGFLLPPSCTSTGGRYTNDCHYNCASNYELQGNVKRRCKADGTWGGTAPTCKKIVVSPWISCPASIHKDLPKGQATTNVSSEWGEPRSNLKPSEITISPPEISPSYQFPAKKTKVTWTASNSAGSENCSIYVTIFDKEAPKVTYCPANILKISDGKKAVTWVEAKFSDNIKVTKIESSEASGDIFPLGTTNVHYTAKDAAGNSNDECEFYVQLKRPSCYDPIGPTGGTKSCHFLGTTKWCTVTCTSGTVLYKPKSPFWTCESGVWSPSDVIPDCVEAVEKNTSCQENWIEMTVRHFAQTQTYCAKCPSGTFKSSVTDCSPCPAGTHNNQQGQLQCVLTCPPGTSSLPGAKSSSDCKPKCPKGRFSETGLGPNCHHCPRNTYQDKVQQMSCIPCPNGTSTLTLGANSPSDCGARPQIIKIDPLIDINENDNVNLSCFATGIPTPTYKWEFLKDIAADFLGRMSQSSIKNSNGEVIGSRLSIQAATHENSGSYECRVTNTHGEDKGLAQLNVAKVFINPGSGSDESL
ncbi:sushi, von Willebrand factor type A, EGF and pentraxin domain-containing protein 1-like [Montipora foliosa]|uniref:sushi, von Willebrand factor type A, EGF and pentraxin domain-containing protein 1-like n=1 Tax=Montipora foliosa TaxID=591990 RepID=UPI0035F1FD9C